MKQLMMMLGLAAAAVAIAACHSSRAGERAAAEPRAPLQMEPTPAADAAGRRWPSRRGKRTPRSRPSAWTASKRKLEEIN